MLELISFIIIIKISLSPFSAAVLNTTSTPHTRNYSNTTVSGANFPSAFIGLVVVQQFVNLLDVPQW